MKKLVFIFATAILAVFTQCKKQDSTQENATTNGIQIVLTADNGGSRTSFGVNGSINWNTNEKVFVICNGQCVGYVTNGTEGGNIFTGTLTGITENGIYDFHYYYVGNTQTIANEATSFTMNFSNQDGTLAHLGDFHVGYGSQSNVEVILGETVNSQARMKSLVSIAYFDLAGMAEVGEMVYFYGDNINNQMTIDFSTNTPSYGRVYEEGVNYICAGTVAEDTNSPCYVMLLPNHIDGTEELTTDFTFVSKRTTGTCNNVFNYGIVGGRFYCQSGDTNMPIAVNVESYDEGALRGLFGISINTQTHFSQGNLKYEASTNSLSFEEEQLSKGDVFCWGTGDDPANNTGDYNDYLAFTDWGINPIVNGGNVADMWRTQSETEWEYIFYDRNDASDKYGTGNVDGDKGMILLPDNFVLPAGISFNSGMASDPNDWTHNSYTQSQWSLMEAAGAVFLAHNDAYYDDSYPVFGGCYWSSDAIDDQVASSLWFDGNLLITNDGSGKIYGFGVRLTRSIE